VAKPSAVEADNQMITGSYPLNPLTLAAINRFPWRRADGELAQICSGGSRLTESVNVYAA